MKLSAGGGFGYFDWPRSVGRLAIVIARATVYARTTCSASAPVSKGHASRSLVSWPLKSLPLDATLSR